MQWFPTCSTRTTSGTRGISRRIVNIKTSALNTRLLKLLCEFFGSDHICLFYHTEARWFPQGNATRVHLKAGSVCSEVGSVVEELGEQTLRNVRTPDYSEPNDEFAPKIVRHFSLLKIELMHYFPNVTCRGYIANPFSVDPAELPVGTGEQEEFIHTQADETAKTKHEECSPINFWLSMVFSYSTLARQVVLQLLIFPSTWKYE
uniref:Uncharacterized protein n=1 Tax=Octopus bimaculoides TaxID=37653 RepID=A0A0L8IHQ6_OCTBM